MSRPERREALEDIVVSVIREAILMDEGEDLPTDVGFFDLGLSSLRLNDIRSRLEGLLGIPIDATVLFGQPTVDQLVIYLTEIFAAVPDGKEPCNAA